MDDIYKKVEDYIEEQLSDEDSLEGFEQSTQVFIVIEGGVVQQVKSSDASAVIHVIDLDDLKEKKSNTFNNIETDDIYGSTTIWEWPETQV